MRLLALIQAYFLAIGTTTTKSRSKVGNTWYIDGNNLLGNKLGVAKDVDLITQKLQAIQGQNAVVLVFDGRKGIPDTTVTTEGSFQRISLGEGLLADDYILDELKAIRDAAAATDRKVQVVTADRKLRKAVLAVKPIVRGVVNPVRFWKRYLPRLSGQKLRKSANEKENDEL